MSRDDSDRLRSWRDRFSELGIDAPLSHPDCFKKALHIGEDAYTSLRIKRLSLKVLGPLGAAGTGAAVAKSSLVATTFFPAGGILGLIGLGTAATPVGWAIATAALSGTAWGGYPKNAGWRFRETRGPNSEIHQHSPRLAGSQHLRPDLPAGGEARRCRRRDSRTGASRDC